MKTTTLNVKIPNELRDKFKVIAHNKGTTMQALLLAFTESFTNNPDKFKMKMEINNV